MTDKHLFKVEKMPTNEAFMSEEWTSRLDYVGLVKNDGGGGVDTNKVFYNFNPQKVTILKVKIEKPGNYGLGSIIGVISKDKPTIIDWGNGKSTTLTTLISVSTQAKNSTDFYAYYSEAGEYEISIDGWYNHFQCCDINTIKSGVTQINEVLIEISQVSSLITHFGSTFRDCKNLTEIPTGLFDKNVNVTNFQWAFYNCKSLTEIPNGLFDSNTKVTSFWSTFSDCSSLTEIPSGLFDKNVNVTDFQWAFANCKSLTEIPNGLFDKNANVTDFSHVFSGCSSLTEIPSGLFDNNTIVTDFGDTFFGCSGLTSIPSGLFDKNIKVTRFESTFSNCSSLTNIPSSLFGKNTAVTDFKSTFSSCSSLTSIPSGLFDKNKKVTNFDGIFYNCYNLTGETPYTLSSDGVTRIKLWDRNGTNGFAKPTKTYTAFYKCRSLTDYEKIPTDWK